ncbi:hypothetical protein EDF31_102108 [Curtobacterium sp. PhB142]|uniref:hypothetical protein n=1 Tax=unclassified Curtobacterium TaxID=257496 RepID=UPI0010521903|nr:MULTISPECIES: hypothetical protein [unclassified Curtobacterium]MBF4585178.1 hypothetical protein [Curtobacterium sp. VKM Ac-2887]TCL87410.1 hypothetical protein EDF31_102108 [Curtobacterium sp. PhB142]TCM05241.1 hypothetical protein EDF26_101471 [Curtobacterium sp. PhB134]
MVPTVTFMDRSSIAIERSRLLALAHMPLADLRKKGATFQLDPEEQSILRALDELDFLEGDD